MLIFSGDMHTSLMKVINMGNNGYEVEIACSDIECKKLEVELGLPDSLQRLFYSLYI